MCLCLCIDHSIIDILCVLALYFGCIVYNKARVEDVYKYMHSWGRERKTSFAWMLRIHPFLFCIVSFFSCPVSRCLVLKIAHVRAVAQQLNARYIIYQCEEKTRRGIDIYISDARRAVSGRTLKNSRDTLSHRVYPLFVKYLQNIFIFIILP